MIILGVRNNLTFTFYPGCELRILSSTSWSCPGGPETSSSSWCQIFLASNLLTLGTDHWSGYGSSNPSIQYDANYWLTEQEKTGEEQGFILDLGCEKTVQGLTLRNTHNGRQGTAPLKSSAFLVLSTTTDLGTSCS